MTKLNKTIFFGVLALVALAIVLSFALGVNNEPRIDLSDQSEGIEERPLVLVGQGTIGGPNSRHYEGRIILEGLFYEDAQEGPGGRVVFFEPNELSREKLPLKNGERAAIFVFKNHDKAVDEFDINERRLIRDDSICQVSGSARIVISDYTLLLAEIGGLDTATLEEVIRSSDPIYQPCF